ncbi:MAG: transcription/translation regulatory transformer protein RfaH [Ectothiorhodospiraceae bacterium]|nr:transcription/translation regulatory transformer protein RfaH [Ectothiorhodospiraceae bacterium]MCH8505564.1 transcription/translation regulatory transformer protein RfaH [Ectothiorhodospiraceae bacterium]
MPAYGGAAARGLPGESKRWYAVHCKPRQDARAEEHLANQGYELFRPRVRVRMHQADGARDRVESMFPRYLFIRLDALTENWGPIRSTRGVAGLVRWGDHVPTVPEEVIESLRRRTDEEGCLDLTGQNPYQPNDRVRITEGPFAGYQALYLANSGRERVIVLLSILQQSQQITLPAHAITRE